MPQGGVGPGGVPRVEERNAEGCGGSFGPRKKEPAPATRVGGREEKRKWAAAFFFFFFFFSSSTHSFLLVLFVFIKDEEFFFSSLFPFLALPLPPPIFFSSILEAPFL